LFDNKDSLFITNVLAFLVEQTFRHHHHNCG